MVFFADQPSTGDLAHFGSATRGSLRSALTTQATFETRPSPAPCAEIGHTPDAPQAALARSSKVNGQDPGPDPGGHCASGIVASPAYRACQGPAGGRVPVAAGPGGPASASSLIRSPAPHRGGAVRLPAGDP